MQLIDAGDEVRNMPFPDDLITPYHFRVAQVCKSPHILVIVPLLYLLLHELLTYAFHTLIIISSKINSVQDLSTVSAAVNLPALTLVYPLSSKHTITPAPFRVAAVCCVEILPRSFSVAICISSSVFRPIRP